MSLTRGQQRLVELALEGLDTVRDSDRAPVEYILDQLINGACPEYHGGERPERPPEDVDFLIDLLRSRMRSLPKLSEVNG